MKNYNRKQFILISAAAVAAFSIEKYLNIIPGVKKYFHELMGLMGESIDFSKGINDICKELATKIDCIITDNSECILALHYKNDIMEAPVIFYKNNVREEITDLSNKFPKDTEGFIAFTRKYFLKPFIDSARRHYIEIYNRPDIIEMLQKYNEGDEIPEESYSKVSLIYADLIKRGKFPWDCEVDEEIDTELINSYET